MKKRMKTSDTLLIVDTLFTTYVTAVDVDTPCSILSFTRICRGIALVNICRIVTKHRRDHVTFVSLYPEVVKKSLVQLTKYSRVSNVLVYFEIILLG